MVVPANAIPVQELRRADGQVFAVLVTPEEFARLQADVALTPDSLLGDLLG